MSQSDVPMVKTETKYRRHGLWVNTVLRTIKCALFRTSVKEICNGQGVVLKYLP